MYKIEEFYWNGCGLSYLLTHCPRAQFSSRSLMSQLFFRIFLNSKEMGSNASGGTDLLQKARLCKQENKFPFLMPFIQTASGRYGLDYRQIFPPQNIWISTSNYFIMKKISHMCTHLLGCINTMGLCLHCVCVLLSHCRIGHQISQELEIQLFVSFSLSVLGIELSFSARKVLFRHS